MDFFREICDWRDEDQRFEPRVHRKVEGVIETALGPVAYSGVERDRHILGNTPGQNRALGRIFELKTVKPDIIFEALGKKYAIEVETGKVLHNDKKKFANKVKNLKNEFGKNWFFALTNRNLFEAYKKFGETYHKRNLLKKIQRCFEHE